MVVKSMPLAVAQKNVGDKRSKKVEDEQKKKLEAMSEKNIAARAEFDLNEDDVSNYELWSWYGFDWANSVYSSVVISMFLPVLMVHLANNFACPYEFLPKNLDGFEESASKWDSWSGHANTSTTCTMNVTNDLPHQLFGNSVNGGMKYYPSSNIINYNNYLDPFYVEDETYLADPASISDCDTSTFGDYEMGFIGNVTGWASACVEGKNLAEMGCRADGSGSSDNPIVGYLEYFVEVLNPSDVVGPYTFITNSSNSHIIPNDGSAIDAEKDLHIGSNGKSYFKMVLNPNKLMVGSTTINVTVTSDTTGKEASFAFTVNTLIHQKCPYRVPFMGINILPVSFTTAVISLSVLGQAILYFSVASFGDFGPFRKLLLCYSSLIGCVSCMAIISCDTSEKYLRAGYLTIISNMFFGASYLFYNAYLPYLTRSHPRFLDAKFEYKNIKTGAATGVGAASKKLLDTYHDTQDMISANGYFWGYVSGSFCCFLSIGVVIMIPNLFGVRLIMFLMGLWWFFFALPLFFFLHTRPGPDFPADVRGNPISAITFSWRRIIASLYSMRHLPETLRFLLAYFFFSDGINTIANVAILFAMQDLGMNTLELTILAAESPMFGAVGVWMFRKYQVKKGLGSKPMLLYGIWMLLCIPVYGFIGYLRDWDIWPDCPIGIVQKNEMFVICIVYGMTLGPTQSYARTFFTDLIPPGQEAEYFGVFEISDRGSSWIGPLVVSFIYESTGVMRHAMWYLGIVVVVGMILVIKTDGYKGSDDCRRKEVLIRMVADRKKFGIHKAGAPPSAKRMAGLKSSKLYTGQSGYSNQSGMSTTSSRSTRSSASGVEQPSSRKFSFHKKRVTQDPDFGGATVVEQEEDKGGFGNATLVEDTGGGGFGSATVVEQGDNGGFGSATVVEDTEGGGFGNATVVEQEDDGGTGFESATVVE